jgi:hypothetical protein
MPLFGGGSCGVLGAASFILRNAGGFAFSRYRSYGALGGNKRDAGHGDPFPLRHELGQRRSAAKPNPETVVHTLLQSRPYLQNNVGSMPS